MINEKVLYGYGVNFILLEEQSFICYDFDLCFSFYKSLSIERRIAIKEITVLITGFEWSFLCSIFGLKDCIRIVYTKLKMMGFAI